MTKVRIGLFVFCIAVAVTIASAATMMKATVVPPGSVKWMPMTGMSGVSQAVLYGTPSKAGSGLFVERLMVSKDTTFPIHYHPTDELVTVLRGTLTFGTGNAVDWSKATTLSAGGFAGVPAGLHHYGKLTAGSIIEISGTAPDTLIPVKSAKPSM
jgi:quercetin dioxygenase-like cupin family protein